MPKFLLVSSEAEAPCMNEGVLFQAHESRPVPNQPSSSRPPETAEKGLDPNRWFDHVEKIAARRIGRETVSYVRDVYKYHVAYRLERPHQALGGAYPGDI